MKLIIEDDEGRKTVIPLVRDEISIGRQEGNTIRLTERNVSRRHARLLKRAGHVLIEDVGSSNGVRVNGERIEDQIPLFDGDRVQIGDYGLAVEGAPRPAATEANPRIRLDEAHLEQAPLHFLHLAAGRGGIDRIDFPATQHGHAPISIGEG